jgi:hypothetical protein
MGTTNHHTCRRGLAHPLAVGIPVLRIYLLKKIYRGDERRKTLRDVNVSRYEREPPDDMIEASWCKLLGKLFALSRLGRGGVSIERRGPTQVLS